MIFYVEYAMESWIPILKKRNEMQKGEKDKESSGIRLYVAIGVFVYRALLTESLGIYYCIVLECTVVVLMCSQ